jgi:hypothetical protein
MLQKMVSQRQAGLLTAQMVPSSLEWSEGVVTLLPFPIALGQKVVPAVVAEEAATTRSTTVATSTPMVNLQPFHRSLCLDLQQDISRMPFSGNQVNTQECIAVRKIAICRYHLTTTPDSKMATRRIASCHLSTRLFQATCTITRGPVRCQPCHRHLTLLTLIPTL